MKTWLKLWIVALSLVAMATTIYTQTVKADTSAEVKVTIIEGTNQCNPMSGYIWDNITASISDTTLTGIENDLYCYLLKDAAWNITFTLTNLTAAGITQNIANTWFTIGSNVWTFTWSLTPDAWYWPTLYTIQWNAQWGTFYEKQQHEVWEFTKTITISWVVPAWTPVATYTWELNIVVPNS